MRANPWAGWLACWLWILAGVVPFRPTRSSVAAASSIPEPYQHLHHCNSTALPSRPLSPDPLARYSWEHNGKFDHSELQLYDSLPVSWTADPPHAFRVPRATSAESKVASIGVHSNIHVDILAPGMLTLDFGVERAGWFEFDSNDLGDDEMLKYLKCSLSEYDQPLEDKTKMPVRYGTNNYRLETNTELYEGIRFVFVMFDPPSTDSKLHRITYPIRLTNVRVVSQICPVSYASYYSSPDNLLTKVWYSGAYGVRLNMHKDDFGTVLIERGDRVAIQGDQHPTIAAALAAFGDGNTSSGQSVYGLIRSSLNKTDSGCDGCRVVDDGIMSYPILWAMSVLDYYWATGDVDTFAHYKHDIENILDKSSKVFYPDIPNIVWQGWDDRLDDGWCGPCSEEAQLTFANLVVRAHNDFVGTLVASGKNEWADDIARYASKAKEMAERLTAQPNWSDSYGLHASANAINAALPTLDPALMEHLFEREFNDVVRICSFSAFNQYWILQAMGNANKMDHALASIRLCWGTMTKVTKGCFLEIFDPRWFEEWIMRHDGAKAPGPPSYCHPWSRGVTHWLTETHVGIRPLRPGYEVALLSPFVSKMNPSINGSVGTPVGAIDVDAVLDVTEGIVQVRASSPVKTRVAFRKNLDGCVLIAMALHMRGNAEDAHPLRMFQSNSIGQDHLRLHPHLASSLVFSELLEPGQYVIVGKYGACQRLGALPIGTTSDSPYPPFPPLAYPAATQVDSETRGNWKGMYGTNGFILCGFDNGKGVVSLPSYAGNVTKYYMWGGGPHDPQSHFRGKSQTNATYLQSPSKKGWRALGSIGDEVREGRGLVIDIPILESNLHSSLPTRQIYRISVYMVASDPDGEFVVKAMDYRSRSSIAPLAAIRDHSNGTYWTIEYSSGVRLRFAPLSGATTINAIFFERISHNLGVKK